MSTEPSSLERAFRAEVGAGALLGVESDPEQLDLLRDDDGKLPNDIFRKMREMGRSGPGRRPGSRNKRNDALAKLICQQHGDPVMFMASMYSMPLDQMIDLVLVADSTAEREGRLFDLIDRCDATMKKLLPVVLASGSTSEINKITHALERISDAAKALKMKPGDLAIKALGLQLGAAKSVAEYVHSKKPVEANVTVGFDATLLMVAPQSGAAGPVETVMGNVQHAINDGVIDASRLQDLRIVDGEFSMIDGDDEDEGE